MGSLARALCLAAVLVGGPVATQGLLQADDPTFMAAGDALAQRIAQAPRHGRPRNVILFIADGAGPEMIAAIRLAAGQAAGGPGEDHVLSFEAFPHLALAKTWNVDAQTPDSAGTATAMMSGIKTNKGVIGVGPQVARGDCVAALAHPATTLGELAEANGLATGIVTTAALTHATPAAFYAHSPERDWESDERMPPGTRCLDIARQLAAFPFEVALGGGRARFLPANAPNSTSHLPTGLRADGRDLLAEWAAAGQGRVAVGTGAELAAALADPPDRILGLFGAEHMAYEADRARGAPGVPSLSQMTEAAIGVLERRDRGYLLLVEGGLIDPALHERDLPRALIEGIEFDGAVATAIRMTNPAETLILVTSDHGHQMPPWAQAPRGAAVGGLDTWRAEANPPGQKSARRVALQAPSLLDIAHAIAGRPLGSRKLARVGSHNAVDVAVYASGPMAHLVAGTVEQTYLFHLIAHALGLDAAP